MVASHASPRLQEHPYSREDTPGTAPEGEGTRQYAEQTSSDEGYRYSGREQQPVEFRHSLHQAHNGSGEVGQSPQLSWESDSPGISALYQPSTTNDLYDIVASPSPRTLPPSDDTHDTLVNHHLPRKSKAGSSKQIYREGALAPTSPGIPEYPQPATECDLGEVEVIRYDLGTPMTLKNSTVFMDEYGLDGLAKRKRHSTAPAFDFDVEGELQEADDPKSTEKLVEPEPEDSPYPEVQASVSNVDHLWLPVTTFRMWIIGLLLCCITAGLNTFFNFRYPAPDIVPLVLIITAHPLGKLAAYILPIRSYRMPEFLGSFEFSLNPGPWSIKEHACVYIMANVAVTVPYAINTIVVSEVFYKMKLGFGFNLTFLLATQLTGFGLAGVVRRVLVWPASMVWPQNLVACSLLNTLHAECDSEDKGISRYKFFVIAIGLTFFYYFLPGFLFQALSMFNYICWIFPDNIVVNQLFGVRSGLGMGILTFDWSQISFIGSPLMIPWWAQFHVMVGFIVFFWVIGPCLYYTDVWNLSQFPMAANFPYDISGHKYNISRVSTGPQHRFNSTAYEDYSPLFLPTTYVLVYLLSFALATATITHTILYHGPVIVENVLRPNLSEDDIHAKLMRRYPEVPNLWYAITSIVFFSIGVLAVKLWPAGTPVWCLVLAIALSIIYILPAGFIYAMTGQVFTLNVVAEMISGALLPGSPLTNMTFKAYSVQTLSQALLFVQDLKLGHYMKIPPRATFLTQMVATIVTSFVQVGVKEWMLANIPDICEDKQLESFTCPDIQVYYTASAVWGLIGPSRQFGRTSIYGPELYALAIGALIPLPFWLWRRKFPNKYMPIFHMPVLLNGITFIPPATGINYSSWFTVGFIFQYIIRRKRFAWWSKFNYILSAALDSGTVLSMCAVFFLLQFLRGGVHLKWTGNSIFHETADWKHASLKPSGPPIPLPSP